MKKIISLAAVTILLTACGGGSSTSSGSSTSGSAFLVKNMQGGETDLVGTWKESCVTNFDSLGNQTADTMNTSVYTNTTATAFETTFASVDGTCGGATTETGRATASIAVGADITASGGWVGLTGAATAPTANDGTTTLPSAPVATQILATNVVGSGSYSGASAAFTSQLAIDASVATKITSYDVFDGGTGAFIADLSVSETKQ